MPKRYRRSTKKRSFRRKKRFTRKKRGRTMKGTSVALPLGKTFKFKTRYCQLGNVLNVGASGFPVTHVWSLNGIFDPNITGTGHQPIGFDELMPFYDHYCVIGARVRVTATNHDPNQAQTIALQIKDNDSTSVLLTQAIENGLVNYKTLGRAGTAAGTKTLTTMINTSKFFGRKVLQGTKYQGTISANPEDGVYLHVIVSPADQSTDLGSVFYTIEIEYVAILTEPKVLGQS